jgi:hypothetical protein
MKNPYKIVVGKEEDVIIWELHMTPEKFGLLGQAIRESVRYRIQDLTRAKEMDLGPGSEYLAEREIQEMKKLYKEIFGIEK